MAKLIGLCGFARSGKDEVARILGWNRIAFADRLKDLMSEIDPLLRCEAGAYPFSELANIWGGHEGVKASSAGPSYRRFLQNLGEGTRGVDSSIWVDYGIRQAERFLRAGHDVAITDVRYPNEARAVRRLGGQLWRIDRMGVGPANGHVSESNVMDFSPDLVIKNNGTLAELRLKVIAARDGLDA